MAIINILSELKWPNGIVPYNFELGFPYEKNVKEAIAIWNEESDIRIVPSTDQVNYVTFKEGFGDASGSEIGCQGGQQFIEITPDFPAHLIVHELGHCIGLAHEQCRFDRDKYIRVDPDNFMPGYGAYNWAIQSREEFEDYGKYDLRSIMHYSRHTGAKQLGQYQWTKGWTTVEFYEVLSTIFLLLIKTGNGTAHLHKMKDDGVVGARVKNYDWRSGWTISRQYTCGFQRFLALYDGKKGTARFHLLDGDGTLGKRVDAQAWSAGWTSLEFYLIGTQCFLFLLKASTGTVHIHKMESDGSVGELAFTKNWSKGWTQAQPYSAGFQRYFSILKSAEGRAEFLEIKSDGDFGTTVKKRNWSSGWTDVQFYQAELLIYMLTYKRETGLVHIRQIEGGGKYGQLVQTIYVEADWTTVRVFTSGLYPRLFLLNSATGVVKIWPIDSTGKLYNYEYTGNAITVLPPNEYETALIGTYKSPSAKDIAAVNYLVKTAPSVPAAKRSKRSRKRWKHSARG